MNFFCFVGDGVSFLSLFTLFVFIFFFLRKNSELMRRQLDYYISNNCKSHCAIQNRIFKEWSWDSSNFTGNLYVGTVWYLTCFICSCKIAHCTKVCLFRYESRYQINKKKQKTNAIFEKKKRKKKTRTIFEKKKKLHKKSYF